MFLFVALGMPLKWTEEKSDAFWRDRPWQLVARDDFSAEKVAKFGNEKESRERQEKQSFENFVQQHGNKQQSANAETFMGVEESEDLLFWATHCAWTKCQICQSLEACKLYPKFRKRPVMKTVKDCGCSKQRYVVPTYEEIPIVLRNLSEKEIWALRPLDIHLGEYAVRHFGYRQKGGMFRLSWSEVSVEDKIAALPRDSRVRCQAALDFLMSNRDSAYSSFVSKRELALTSNQRFNLYDFNMSRYVENCLWPHLYPLRAWCETGLDGSESRLSSKVAFMKKVTSRIGDYSLSFELLHFHYDLWLFKTVSGAVSVGRNQFCSPAKSLETKPFSTEYWRWQLKFLTDAVRQFGPPSAFITISPFEWSFPFPPWIENLRQLTGRGPTQLAALESLHIVQVLEQVARGYLGGTNSNTWSNQIFNYNRLPGNRNVNTLFYRFEFQQRGTVHLHMLVFLKDMKYIRLNTIRGDIPWSEPELAHLVHKLQPSDKGCLSYREQPSELNVKDGQPCLNLHHPAEAFADNLRAYISTVIPALKCRMDVQTADGNGMLLRYVTSYVAKCHDNQMTDALYSNQVNPFQAAYRHLRMNTPLEPEMLMALTAKRVAYTCSRTKKITCPDPQGVATMSSHQKYKQRKPDIEHLSFLEWLRLFDDSARSTKPYKSGETLVGIKMKSPTNGIYFFQDLLLHYPHRSESQLYHPDHERMPQQIRHFAAAWLLRPEVWQNLDAVEGLFKLEGHKTYYIRNIVSHVKSLTAFFHLWQRQVFGLNTEPIDISSQSESEFDAVQLAVLNHVRHAVAMRHSQLSEEQDCPGFLEDDDESDEQQERPASDQTASCPELPSSLDLDWRKLILLVGKPGTGKTHTVCTSVQRTLQDQFKVAIAAPTGFLTNLYRAQFEDEAYIDTVHAMLRYPVDSHVAPAVNWCLAEYDLLLIDEVSMIPKKIFHHIMRTLQDLPLRPVVLLSGDPQQQQPITDEGNRTAQTESILHDRKFYSLVYKYTLVTQYRCEDQQYYDMLNHLRYFVPSLTFLSELHKGRVLVTGRPVEDDDLYIALSQFPASTFLTVSRRSANRINRVALERLFSDPPLDVIQYDCDMPPMPVYRGMKVLVTQNRDKKNGVVNGKRATVVYLQDATIFLRLPNGLIVQTYPVTVYRGDQLWTSYPFVPAYALTITKAQGQTLESAIVWLDSRIVPAGGAYVALSRIRKMDNLRFLVSSERIQYNPVSVLPS